MAISTGFDVVKDPDARLDYPLDWSRWLEAFETITSVAFSADPGIVIDSQSNTTKAATVWLTGGTEGQTYRVVCRVTTSSGRIDDRTFVVRCAER